MRVAINEEFDGMDYIEIILTSEEIESLIPLGISEEFLEGFKKIPLNVFIRPETDQERIEREYINLEEEIIQDNEETQENID
jgi:hypothetical protein